MLTVPSTYPAAMYLLLTSKHVIFAGEVVILADSLYPLIAWEIKHK